MSAKPRGRLFDIKEIITKFAKCRHGVRVFMFYDVFISYSRKDSEIANKIYNTLTSAGLTCFIDLEGISGGADFPSVLAQAIMESRLMLLVASKNFYASEYAMKEVTFAVNNKGSRFILPVIIERGELPKNLEFILSNINWRELSRSYRIETELLADVQEKLANPHAGETLAQYNKKKSRITNGIVVGSLALVVILVTLLTIPGSIENRKREQEYEKALCASHTCRKEVDHARTLWGALDSLRSDKERQEDTFQEELTIMGEMQKSVTRADSIIKVFSTQPAYSYLFAEQRLAVDAIEKTLTAQKDSMATSWRSVALSCYDLYIETRDTLDLVIAQEYVNKAYALNPNDSQLLAIHDNITQP